MEYKIVSAWEFKALEVKVNELLKEGWVLQGGGFYTGSYTCQAMTKPGPCSIHSSCLTCGGINLPYEHECRPKDRWDIGVVPASEER